MPTTLPNRVYGVIGSQLDIPTIVFWIFVLFFLALVFWLQRENKREGYPLKASPFTPERIDGFPPMPTEPLIYLLNEGGSTQAPHHFPQAPMHAAPVHRFDGTPLSPLGNPLLAGIGPGSWVRKRDDPARNERGELMLQPLRLLPEWSVLREDSDPRGMAVVDWRLNPVGRVSDVWVDLGAKIIRFLEVELNPALGAPNGPSHVLVPIFHTDIAERTRRVRVTALWAHQFAEIPTLATPGIISGQEEERLNAYFNAGEFFRGSPVVAPQPERPIWPN